MPQVRRYLTLNHGERPLIIFGVAPGDEGSQDCSAFPYPRNCACRDEEKIFFFGNGAVESVWTVVNE